MGFPFDPGGAAFGTGTGGVVGLVLAVVKFGDEITADGVALRALSDAAGDADLVPVNGLARLDSLIVPLNQVFKVSNFLLIM